MTDEWWNRSGYSCRTIPADDGFYTGRPRPEQVKVSLRPLCGCYLVMDRDAYDSITDTVFEVLLDNHRCDWSDQTRTYAAMQAQGGDQA